MLLLVTLVKACSVLFFFTVSFNCSAPAWTSYQLEFSFVVSGDLQRPRIVVFSGVLDSAFLCHCYAPVLLVSSCNVLHLCEPSLSHRGIRLGSPLFSFKSVRRDFQTNVSRVQDEALHRESLSPPPPSLLAPVFRRCLLWGSTIRPPFTARSSSLDQILTSGALCLSTDDLHSSLAVLPDIPSFRSSDCSWYQGSVLAWSNLFADYIITPSSPPKLLYLKMMIDFGDMCYLAKMLRISGGFTGVFNLSIMSYFSFLKKFILPVGSSGISLSLPYLLSMKGDAFSEQYSSFNFSLHTGLPSCVAVRTGPKEATKITSVFLVGVDSISTSLVTISQLSDFVLIKEDVKFPLSLVVTKNQISKDGEEKTIAIEIAINRLPHLVD
ncbi:hypothetical protein Bca101_022971 [Brassica carinata]